jgi:iron complex outermembrane receptor protein
LNDYGLQAVGSIESVNQELRIANGGQNRLRYTLGGNFERSIVDDNGQLSYVDSTLNATYNFAHNGLISNQTMKNTAVFGSSDYSVTDWWTLKGGARYTKADRSDDGCSYDPGDGHIAAFFTFLSSLVRGTPTPPIAPGSCTSLNAQFLPTEFKASLDQQNVSWRVGSDFKPTDSSLLYLNVAKGYKAGSFPNAAASTTAQFAPVTQESILDYEGGFKTQLLDGKASLNGALFYYDYKDKQIRSKLVDPVFGVLDALVNIPKSSVKGAELAFEAAPIAGIRTNLAVTYLDSKIDRFVGVNGTGATSNFAGSSIPFTPKFSATAGLSYTWEVSPTWSASIGGNALYNAKTYSVVGNDPVTLIKSYTLLDVRAGLETKDQKWRVQLWGKNVTNQYYWTNAIVVYDTQVRYAGMPATFGVTLGYRY